MICLYNLQAPIEFQNISVNNLLSQHYTCKNQNCPIPIATKRLSFTQNVTTIAIKTMELRYRFNATLHSYTRMRVVILA